MHEQTVSGQECLTDVDVARRLVRGVTVPPEGLPDLEEFVEGWRQAAILEAKRLSAGRRVNFLRIVPIVEFDVPDTTGMSHDEALDAWYDARDATEKVTGYRLDVTSSTVERVAEVVAKTPRIHARVREMAQVRAQSEAARLALRRLRGPRRRGAGRPGAVRRPRAHGPPDSDDDPADPEPDPDPHPVARRPQRRVFCVWGWRP